jgi:hypothetical protein
MSLLSISQLAADPTFTARVNSCTIQQAEIFVNSALPAYVALAQDIMRGGPISQGAFLRLVPAAPGLADQADTGDGTIDQANISDAEILAAVQALWPTVAALYWDNTGAK